MPRIVVTEYQMKMNPSDPDLSALSWLTIIENAPIDPALPPLGAGETAAIALAKALSARFILIDERKARRIASNQGLVVAGTLGVLTRAKDQSLVSAIKPHIEAMEAQGRYFGEALIEKVLRDVGE